jgi:hypothetical protein
VQLVPFDGAALVLEQVLGLIAEEVDDLAVGHDGRFDLADAFWARQI